MGCGIELNINGAIHSAKCTFTYNLGQPMREAVVGSDAVDGYKESPQVAF